MAIKASVFVLLLAFLLAITSALHGAGPGLQGTRDSAKHIKLGAITARQLFDAYRQQIDAEFSPGVSPADWPDLELRIAAQLKGKAPLGELKRRNLAIRAGLDGLPILIRGRSCRMDEFEKAYFRYCVSFLDPDKPVVNEFQIFYEHRVTTTPEEKTAPQPFRWKDPISTNPDGTQTFDVDWKQDCHTVQPAWDDDHLNGFLLVRPEVFDSITPGKKKKFLAFGPVSDFLF